MLRGLVHGRPRRRCAKGTASAAPAIASAATATAATATTAAAAHPTPPRASAGGPQRALKFGWCREWLSTQLVGLAVQDAEGNFIGIHELRGLRGEAYVEERVVRAGRSGSGERTAVKEGQEEMAAEERITTRHVYDLSLSLSWKAKLAGGTYEGEISLSEVASHSEPSEYEVPCNLGGGAARGLGRPDATSWAAGTAPVRGSVGRRRSPHAANVDAAARLP